MRFQFTHPRGVRWIATMYPYSIKVSIHAPARGAIRARIALSRWICFNSRTREGCDSLVGVPFTENSVSIHAPARGAISTISRPNVLHRFQFTHPRGVRCTTRHRHSNIGSFNSRTREGCDFDAGFIVLMEQVSIHAPARGAIGLQKNLIK